MWKGRTLLGCAITDIFAADLIANVAVFGVVSTGHRLITTTGSSVPTYTIVGGADAHQALKILAFTVPGVAFRVGQTDRTVIQRRSRVIELGLASRHEQKYETEL